MDTINLQKVNDDIIITIASIHPETRAIAMILNYSGEVIIKYQLMPGINQINVSAFRDKNCAIRIMNDKNVLVQQI